MAACADYHGSGCLNSTGGIGNSGSVFDCIDSPLTTITKANQGGKTVGVEGCGVNGPSKDPEGGMDAALAAAKAADTVVLVMGIDGVRTASSSVSFLTLRRSLKEDAVHSRLRRRATTATTPPSPACRSSS